MQDMRERRLILLHHPNFTGYLVFCIWDHLMYYIIIIVTGALAQGAGVKYGLV
jgi:hypothetical protein